MGSPAVYTPFTKHQQQMFSNQGKRCAEFEMDFFRCASRVGAHRSNYDCKKELEDFQECAFRNKQFQRYCIMQAERKKQGRPFPPTPHPSGVIIF